jgi:hypothetical protein
MREGPPPTSLERERRSEWSRDGIFFAVQMGIMNSKKTTITLTHEQFMMIRHCLDCRIDRCQHTLKTIGIKLQRDEQYWIDEYDLALRTRNQISFAMSFAL